MSQFKIGKIYELESPKRGSFVGKFLGGDSTKASNFAELTMMERAREAAIGDNWNELELPGFRETILNVPEAQRSVVAMMFSSNDPEKQKAAVKRVDPDLYQLYASLYRRANASLFESSWRGYGRCDNDCG